MKIKLLHLYDDSMNLYGEYANLLVLERCLTDLGHEVCVDKLGLYETKDISGYDFYYMGAGTERKMKQVLPQLAAYRKTLQEACAAGKVLLFTGNACDLLGKTVTDAAGKTYEALGIGDFESRESDRRITGDCLAAMDDMLLVGFINKCSKSCAVKTPLLRMSMGFGNEANRGEEGFREKNCMGTHLVGPVLVKNPAFLAYVVELLTGTKTELPALGLYENMEKGYALTKTQLVKRMEAGN